MQEFKEWPCFKYRPRAAEELWTSDHVQTGAEDCHKNSSWGVAHELRTVAKCWSVSGRYTNSEEWPSLKLNPGAGGGILNTVAVRQMAKD
jgi:hypothetical protein